MQSQRVVEFYEREEALSICLFLLRETRGEDAVMCSLIAATGAVVVVVDGGDIVRESSLFIQG